jgi:hypothetical protein
LKIFKIKIFFDIIYLVRKGGILFDYFYILFHNNSQSEILDPIKHHKKQYITWLIYSFKCLSQKTLSIQKDLDFLTNIYGKRSKSSYHILNQKCISVSRTTNWRYMNKKYQQTVINNQKLFENNNTIIWIDNYSKFYKLSRPKYIISFFFLILKIFKIKIFS